MASNGKPRMQIIRKMTKPNLGRRLRQPPGSNRVGGQVYDAPLRKGDYGPIHDLGCGGPLGRRIPMIEGSYANYQRMDRTPFIAAAKEWKLGPVKNAVGTWKKANDQVPDDRLGFIQDTVEPIIAPLLSNICDALSMGNSPNKIVYDIETKPIPGVPNSHWVVKETIPLNHETTMVRLDNGNYTPINSTQATFLGLSSGDEDLDPNEVVYARYDPKPYGGYWWWGRSLHENIRSVWAEHEEDRQLMHKLAKKLSSVIAIARIIKGMARDERGKPIDRMETAKEIIRHLYESNGVVFETIGVSEDEIKRKPELAEITDIAIKTVDLGTEAPAMETMLKKRASTAGECVMGWLVPPTIILQGSGKADTEEKNESGLTQSEVIGMWAHQIINQQLVNNLLVLNYGPDAANTVYRAPTKFTVDQRRASDRVMSAIVNQPEVFAIALEVIDLAQVFTDTNTPTLSNIKAVDIPGKLEAARKALVAATKPIPPTKALAVPGSTRTETGNNNGVD